MLDEKILAVVKENLPAQQLEAIKQLMEKADRVDTVEAANENLNARIQRLVDDRDKAETTASSLRTELSTAKSENNELRTQNSALLIKQSAMDLYMDDRIRLFNILDNGFKHYTQTTTRQVVVPGGTTAMAYPDSQGGMTYVPEELPGSVATVAETTQET